MDASHDDFLSIEMRVGRITAAQPLLRARKPAIALEIDFGPYGIKRSSAQITRRYDATHLVGRQVIAVTNFPPKRVAGFLSEVLVLGAVPDTPVEEGAPPDVVLVAPDSDVAPGTRIL